MHKALLLLRRIPRGKVTTYGELARATKSSPRAVGQIMRRNPHPELYPCYKVVASDGKVHGYSGCLKGAKIGKKIDLLQKDGITVEKGKIDLEKYLHKFR
jgi:methylated-DNA-[protein]-cysteine S-methyltransferase